MKLLKGILSYLYKFYFFLVVLVSLLLLYPIYLILLNNEKYFPAGFKVVRFQARLILFFAGIRKEVHGQIPNDESVSYIICPNHSSYLDILLLYSIFPNYFLFLGKQELGKVPVFNIFFKKMNILVDRANPKAAHESLIKACQRMEAGANVVIFPEGTIPHTAPKLKAFKNGAFKAAIQLQLPIVPVTFVNHTRLLQDSMSFNAHARPGKSIVYIHEPIDVSKQEEQDLVALREHCKDIIASKLEV